MNTFVKVLNWSVAVVLIGIAAHFGYNFLTTAYARSAEPAYAICCAIGMVTVFSTGWFIMEQRRFQ